ncbi:allantoinase [Nitzschia inconspicua]|uniref:Allantoinase n=1 Tax=Nitzschia inconspicua TaxID=303405 RepID=A0A9K3KY88_9STRA|nr:allantoinase [Nitzschia inconspicua]
MMWPPVVGGRSAFLSSWMKRKGCRNRNCEETSMKHCNRSHSVRSSTTEQTRKFAVASTNVISIWSPRVVFGGDRNELVAREGTVEINSKTGVIQACFPGETLVEAQRRVQLDVNNAHFLDLSLRHYSFPSLCLSPGLIDVHTHISTLGRNWEGYTSATQAAAAGGITTIIGMPLNSLPPTISVDVVEKELNAARESQLYVDVGLWGGVLPQTAFEDDQLRALLNHPNILGLKAFLSPLSSNAGYQAISVEQLLHVARICGTFQKPILVHCELMTPVGIDQALQSAYPDDGSLDDCHDAHV